MDTERVRRDVAVAAVAAGVAVVATLLLEFVLRVDVSLLWRALPLYVYFVYAFTRKGGPYTRFDTVRTWITLAVASGVAVVALGIAG